ncbi:adhesion G protein-coupled receptor E1-like [Gadus macrocephalus]|uniref:adhesion G protein-coupled receptor E1-like n=1 Tax=Gadus macrocephalus TaxID=80720 RepID=UPI0028CB2198|nr:adhesion G protein-coupled receptor E1-like [Gadus macrocephalus]
MIYWALLLHLSLLVILSNAADLDDPGSCTGYTNLTDPWRNRAFTRTDWPGYPKNDFLLSNKWWRFTGIGGDTAIDDCTYNRGGFQHPWQVVVSYPDIESLTPTKGTTRTWANGCGTQGITIDFVLCPGGFYVFRPLAAGASESGFATYHSKCGPDSCGPLAECTSTPVGGCICFSGYEIPPEHLPVDGSYGCVDIDECVRKPDICGPDSICTNLNGTYNCTCLPGFNDTNPAGILGTSHSCEDINECLEMDCGEGDCNNIPASYECDCHVGYQLVPAASPPCQDIDECFNSTVCGPRSNCTNIPGKHICQCEPGYIATDPSTAPDEDNTCEDVDECVEDITICGPEAVCNNTIGAHFCTCNHGYRVDLSDMIASSENPCNDIDECSETVDLCGTKTVCTNAPGTFDCSCPDGYFPTTGVIWELDVTFCKSIPELLDEITPPEGQTKERAFLGNVNQQLKDNAGVILPEVTVKNCFSASMEVSGANSKPPEAVTSDGDADTGSVMLDISEGLVSSLVEPSQNGNNKTLQTAVVDLSIQTFIPGSSNGESNVLSVKGISMEVNLEALAQDNNGSAAAAVLTLHGIEGMLSHRFFKTENQTEMNSDIITAFLPKTKHSNFSQPVNFTIQHKKKTEAGLVTCVYWEGKDQTSVKVEASGGKEAQASHWSVKGCLVAYSDENYTICSCSHLSTFALILQIGDPPPEDPFLEWLNRVCVIIGLFFFALAIVTFLLCSWNAKINNTARLHLCISLASSHFLMLWMDRYVDNKVACKVMAGVLHFLILASFSWMLLEALQLFLLVRRLSKVQVIQRDGLPTPVLYLIGYGAPFVILGVSAAVFSDGYGATDSQVCWLSTERSFNWALTGPVVALLGMNLVLFCATLVCLRPTLASMKSDVSQSKDTRLIVFKILAQSVILGCTWILGLYQANLFFQVLFILLNSQQGTFLFIVHCLLNKEVRGEYIKWLSCSFGKSGNAGAAKDFHSGSDNMDATEEQENK